MRKRRERGQGFTLIEVLLVAAILCVMAAVTVPTFVRSMRGNRLRTAARTVVMAGRYARSMAVLKQQEMAVTFDMGQANISVHPVALPVRRGEYEPEAEGAKEQDDSRVLEEEPILAPAPATGGVELSRRLDKVRIESVELQEGASERGDGRHSVVYRSNGMCTPYVVKIADEQGATITIHVDAFSSAETERES